ncbi:MAG: hypothetical protein AUK56_04890 [Thiomicrospira sp. CG2_30_44_34]|nr:MAG: hypothetical protein AUK56_04890 [Thiomicrospira sp. CG2_30_44_34]
MKASKVLLLGKEDSGIHNLIVRIHGCHVKTVFSRREAVIILNPNNKTKIIRYVMGSGAMPGVTKESIAIDYDGLDTLGYKMKLEQPCDLVVRKASFVEKLAIFSQHPDLGVNLSLKLGVTGVALGLIGLGLGIISLFQSTALAQ